MKKETVELLKAMHCIMKNLSDEGAYCYWVSGYIPDEPTEEDFESVAECEIDVEGAIVFFHEILNEYFENGFYIDGIMYKTN